MLASTHSRLSIQIVSPFTHLAGHYWPYTVDIVSALSTANRHLEIQVHAAQSERDHHSLSETNACWNTSAPWVRFLISNAYRNQHWGNRRDHISRNIEFYRCLGSAVQASRRMPQASHIHCVESCHGILLRAVHSQPQQTFSTLCIGSPSPSMDQARSESYRKAFDTNRLTFIVETEAIRDAWKPYAGDHVVYIPAAIPCGVHKSITPKEARQRLGLPEDALICLFFGTHREGKDYAIAIKAAKLSKSKPYLLFVGPLISGNDPNKLLQENDYDIGASWNGYYPDEKVNELFAACDAVMLPYNEGYDKGSAVLLQACQYLKPVIATNTGHLAEFVNQHQAGMLFEPGNPQSLADCYDSLPSSSLADIDLMKKSLLATREFYSWKNLLSPYLEIFGLERTGNI